jgi:hypothetical protein
MTGLPNPYPYGLRQLMLTPYVDAQGTILADTSYPMPVAMTMGFSETEQFDELRGDDVLVAVHGRGPQVDWSLEAGGLPIKPWSIISGGMVLEEGVSPNRRVRLRKSGDDQRPYFRADGRSVSDSGGNVVGRIYRCKANGRLQADRRGGAFMTSAIDGVGLPLVGDQGRGLYEWIQNENDTPLSTTPEANPLPIPMNLRPGVVAATTAQLLWDQIPGFDNLADNYQVQQSIDGGITFTNVAGAPGTPDTNSTTVTTLTTATAYQFRVAFVKGGTVTGDFSRPVSVLTA